MSTVQLRREIKKAVDQLPPDRLASLADYVHFLTRPSLDKRLATAEKAVASGEGVNWRRFAWMFEVVLPPEAPTCYAATYAGG
jgi:hypothetical protein